LVVAAVVAVVVAALLAVVAVALVDWFLILIKV
jgi:hypothetical protein